MTNRRLLIVLSSALLMLSLCSGPLTRISKTKHTANTAWAVEKTPHEDHVDHQETEPHGDEDEQGDDGHAEEEGHEGEGKVHLPPERLEALDISLSTVHRGSVKSTLSFPAETMLDPDEEVHLVPRTAGIVREVFARLGDYVSKGDLLAVLESRELGQNKSNLLASLAVYDLAQNTFTREKSLWDAKISAKQDYLEAQQALRSAQIDVESARQALYALGLSRDEVASLPRQKASALTRYEVRAPMDGTIIERHIARGESIDDRTTIFRLANLESLWVMGRVSERDIRRLTPGQEATVQLEAYPGEEFSGKMDYIGSIIDAKSRTVDARVILENPAQRIRAGMFGRLLVFLNTHEHEETLLVPNGALQRTARGAIVYRAEEEGVFEPIEVEILHQSDTMSEVQGPLKENDRVAVGDIFVLKSEAGKETMGGGHSH